MVNNHKGTDGCCRPIATRSSSISGRWWSKATWVSTAPAGASGTSCDRGRFVPGVRHQSNSSQLRAYDEPLRVAGASSTRRVNQLGNHHLPGFKLRVDPRLVCLRHVPRSAHVDGGDAGFDAVHVGFRFEVLRQRADVDPLRIAQSPGAGRCRPKSRARQSGLRYDDKPRLRLGR